MAWFCLQGGALGSPRHSGGNQQMPPLSPTRAAAAARTPHPSVGHPIWSHPFPGSPKTGDRTLTYLLRCTCAIDNTGVNDPVLLHLCTSRFRVARSETDKSWRNPSSINEGSIQTICRSKTLPIHVQV